MKRTSYSSCVGIAVLMVLLAVGMAIPLGVAAQSQEEDEPNDAQEAGTEIENTSVNGEISQQGDTDWYSKEFTTGETVSFAVTKSLREDGLQMTVYAPNGSELNETMGYHGVGTMEVSVPADESGEYHIEIEAVDESNTGIPYTVYAPADEAPPKKRSTEPVTGTQKEIEPNNANQSDPISGKKISGTVSSKNDSDWYAFYADKSQNISITFTKPDESTDLVYRLYQPDEEYVYTYARVENEDTKRQTTVEIERTGIHYLEMASGSSEVYESGDEYTIHFTGQSLPSQPGPSSESINDSSQSTNDTQADEKGGITGLFGPGFTGGGAVVALFVTALFALRRR